MYGLECTSPPASEPVTTATLKAHLRLNTTDEDSLLTAHITAAREQFEHLTDRACITSTWKLYMDGFPRVIRLPRAPLQSVTSVEYYDGNDTLQTWPTSSYSVDTRREPGRVVPSTWFPDWKIWPVYPALSYRRSPKIIVTFVAGWTADTIPALVKQAILLQAASFYEDRSGGMELQPGFLNVVSLYKLGWVTNMNQPWYGEGAGYAVE